MNDLFTKAIKEQIYLRALLYGPPGSGKTYTALEMASNLATLLDTKIAMLDTEGRSSRRYADLFDFSVMDLAGDYNPQYFINAIKSAQDNGYGILVIDSFSAAWNQAGGVLDTVDKASAKMGNNKWAGWAAGRPAHNALVQAIVNAEIHIIGTARSKVEWVLEDDGKGKTKPRKVGFSPVQDGDFEYEFDFALLVGADHKSTIVKSRFPSIDDNQEVENTAALTGMIFSEISDGEKPEKTDVRLDALRIEVNKLFGMPVESSEIVRLANVVNFTLEAFRDKFPGKKPSEIAQIIADNHAAETPPAKPANGSHHEDAAPAPDEAAPDTDPKPEYSDSQTKDTSNSATNGTGNEPAPETNGSGHVPARFGALPGATATIKESPELTQVVVRLHTWELSREVVKGKTLNWMILGGVVLTDDATDEQTTGEVCKIKVGNLDDLVSVGLADDGEGWDHFKTTTGRFDEPLYALANVVGAGKEGFSYVAHTLAQSRELTEIASIRTEDVPF